MKPLRMVLKKMGLYRAPEGVLDDAEEAAGKTIEEIKRAAEELRDEHSDDRGEPKKNRMGKAGDSSELRER